jgi:hypothetical protein
MSRRTVALLGLLVASVAALLAFGPDFAAIGQKVVWTFRGPPPVPPQAASRIDDATGALDVARKQIEWEVDRFGHDLGIGLRIVTTADPRAPQDRAASLLASEPAIPWHPTGTLVVVLHLKGGRVGVASSEAVARAAPQPVVDTLLASRVTPFLNEPLLGVALLSSLSRLRDHLLTEAAGGRLVLDESVLARSSVPHVVEHERESAARCARVAARPGADVAASVEAFGCALVRGDASASASLFTEASAFQVARKPLLPFESRVRAAALDAGRPWSISEVGDRAAVKPANSKNSFGFVPVLLVREQGEWHVDLVEMGKTFHSFGTWWQQGNARGPYWLALGGEPYAGEFSEDLTPIELWGEPLQDAITRLEQTDGPIAKIRLAEILLRNAWLPGEALMRWDEAMALAQNDFATADTFASRAEYLGHPLLGAIAIAPFGPQAAQHLGILLLRTGNIDAGAVMLRQAHAWREAREARRAALPPDRDPEKAI